ncbi:hypothetical protein MTR67_044429 [Solanum verrucosum]|uniref:Transposase-associated domain-containing protein n=1 Tax=Solanum verrucosum TaxID=315347 RepID=A0AAF0UTG7_SOLVR|nr:hypothetical protein MTR67_044429 [Solanum verrucosum]
MVHLYRNGFKPRYFVWIYHGESDGLDGMFYNSMPVDVYNMVAPHGQIRVEQVRVEHDRVHEMINDVFGVQGRMKPEKYFDEAPNEEARRFYDQLEESSRPLCEGSPHSALSVAVKLMNIKSDWNVSNAAMDSMTDSELENCKFCGHARYKRTPAAKMVPVQAMHYLPLILRLKSEPRNVRLGLCSNGFTPFSNNASPHSCWPVFLTPYNLPPEMCMTSPYIFLSCVIPGPRNPTSLIDIYLQPLIDELKQLWFEGVLTYDISTKQNFVMRASLMWTINDFPAYGMLSGWMTTGKLACPYCMENSKPFTLKHDRKNTWFDCHRQFLPMDHEFRKMKNAFRKNKVESDPPPILLTGHKFGREFLNIPKVTEASPSKLPGYGVEHNWTKQSIFWELPYWKDNLLQHNLDVMHIEKNYFDNLFNTMMDVKGKAKDNPKARMDIKEYCRRKELLL